MNNTKHEIIVAAQYLLIGLIALAILLHWFGQQTVPVQFGVWVIAAVGLSFLRILVLMLLEWIKGNRWQSIRRRNWD